MWINFITINVRFRYDWHHCHIQSNIDLFDYIYMFLHLQWIESWTGRNERNLSRNLDNIYKQRSVYKILADSFELAVTLTLHNKSKTMAAPRLNSVLLRSAISGKWHTGSSKYFCSSYGRQAYPQLPTIQKFQTNLTSPCLKLPMFSNQKVKISVLRLLR